MKRLITIPDIGPLGAAALVGAIVALANKIGRMIWALLTKEEDYKIQVIA